MNKAKIWHNPRCSKSREGLAYLEKSGAEVEIFNYMGKPIDAGELAQIIRMSDQPLSDFVRRHEPVFKELELKLDELTPETFARIAAEYPRLLQRPIVLIGGKAVVARPVERIDDLL